MELKESLQKRVEEFKKTYPVEEQAKSRITRPSMAFYGTEILNRAVTALLEGENLLLCGDKATGKMCWQRTWPGSLGGLFMTFLFM